MATITKDILTPGPTVADTSTGLKATRYFAVDGLTGNGDAMLLNALRTAGIPQRGETHDAIPNIRVVSASAAYVPGFASAAIVTVNYESPNATEHPPSTTEAPQISTGSTVQTVETNRHLAPPGQVGPQIILTHTFTDTDTDGNETERIETQTGVISIDVPLTTLALSRLEPEDPESKSIDFTGTINQRDFRGDPQDVWLCTGIEGTSTDGGLTYDVTYNFARNPDTWSASIVFIDPATSLPVENPVLGESFRTLRVYPRTDFDQLNLGI